MAHRKLPVPPVRQLCIHLWLLMFVRSAPLRPCGASRGTLRFVFHLACHAELFAKRRAKCGGALSKKSEPIFAQTGAAAEKPSGWGSRRATVQTCRTSQQNRKRARENDRNELCFRQRRAFLDQYFTDLEYSFISSSPKGSSSSRTPP